jgi:aspartyl-tRNA(Asn)/glutamyl-tRNA(Gln) amidotransferase subunit A
LAIYWNPLHINSDFHSGTLPHPGNVSGDSGCHYNSDAAQMILQSGHNTRPVNYLGFPAVNLPIGFDTNGLPASVQFIGAPFTEAKLLRIARTVERELNFWSVEPRLSVLTK